MINWENNSFLNMWKEMPKFDLNQITEIHKQNSKVFSKIAQTTMEAAQSIVHRQTEVAKDIANDIFNAPKNTNFSNPNEVFNKQIQTVKQNIENCNNNFQEISETLFKSGSEIFNTLSKRSSEFLEECHSLFHCNKKAKAN